jgi:hypothetical protein
MPRVGGPRLVVSTSGAGDAKPALGAMPVGLTGHASAIAGNGLRYRHFRLRRLEG